MARRLPKLLRLDGEEVPIVREELARFPDGYPRYGTYTRARTGRITVSAGQTRASTRDTVTHELLHHLWRKAGIHLSVKTEEYVISCLSPWLVLALQENPSLLAFLTDTD